MNSRTQSESAWPSVRFASVFALVCALLSLFCFLAPTYVIRPFRPQGPREFEFALTVRQAGPIVSTLCLLLAAAAAFLAWPHACRVLSRVGLAICVIAALAGAILVRVNIFEIMFHPYLSPSFGPADSVDLASDDMVISLSVGGETHAYPVGALGYHHIVNDVVGGIPVAATYCTLCHTGIVWKRVVEGRVLTFRLTGIRNGNALLRDEETGSIWQQSTGVAIFGPFTGKQLEAMHSDELTFATWRSEQPRGYVLKPNPQYATLYEKKGWDDVIGKYPSVIDTAKSGIAPRELMSGIAIGSASKAFPCKAILSARLIQDTVGSDAVLLVVGPDGASVRAFRVPANATFLRRDGADGLMTDAGTSSVWNFQGCAVSGPLAGQCLAPLDLVKDYWFDWLNYHPSTAVFRS